MCDDAYATSREGFKKNTSYKCELLSIRGGGGGGGGCQKIFFSFFPLHAVSYSCLYLKQFIKVTISKHISEGDNLRY